MATFIYLLLIFSFLLLFFTGWNILKTNGKTTRQNVLLSKKEKVKIIPLQLSQGRNQIDTYFDSLIELLNSAQKEIILFSPPEQQLGLDRIVDDYEYLTKRYEQYYETITKKAKNGIDVIRVIPIGDFQHKAEQKNIQVILDKLFKPAINHFTKSLDCSNYKLILKATDETTNDLNPYDNYMFIDQKLIVTESVEKIENIGYLPEKILISELNKTVPKEISNLYHKAKNYQSSRHFEIDLVTFKKSISKLIVYKANQLQKKEAKFEKSVLTYLKKTIHYRLKSESIKASDKRELKKSIELAQKELNVVESELENFKNNSILEELIQSK
jgi:hypothetical protein